MSRWRPIQIAKSDVSIEESGDTHTFKQFQQAIKSMQEAIASYCNERQIQVEGTITVQYMMKSTTNTEQYEDQAEASDTPYFEFPVTTDAEDGKKFILKLDVRQSEPENVIVSIDESEDADNPEKFEQAMDVMKEAIISYCNEHKIKIRDTISVEFQAQTIVSKTQSQSESTASSDTTNTVQHQNEAETSCIPYHETPFISDLEEGKKLTLKFDVKQFLPETVTVSIDGNTIQVQARRELKSETAKSGPVVVIEINGEMSTTIFELVEGADATTVQANLSKEGVLTIEAIIPDVDELAVASETE